MNNELIKQKSWWKRNWRWFVPISGIGLMLISLFISYVMAGSSADMVLAYSDSELYQNALEKVKSNQKAIELLGEIEPIDKFAILEGEVHFTNDNQTVNSSIRLIGKKGKARMDISADKINNKWNYIKINVRIKNPPQKRQTIDVL